MEQKESSCAPQNLRLRQPPNDAEDATARALQRLKCDGLLETLRQRHIPGWPLDIDRRLIVAVFFGAPTNGGAKTKTLFTPSVIVVLLSHARRRSTLGQSTHCIAVHQNKGGWVFGRT
jgi:hypothetical protein